MKKNLTVILLLAVSISISAFYGGIISKAANKKATGYALIGGTIYTVDDQNTVAQALVMADGKIVYVGDAEGAKEFITDDIKIIKTEGKMVLPGFIDTHSHVFSAYQSADDLRFDADDSIETWLKQVRKYARKHPDIDRISGFGFTALAFGEAGPHKSLLDKIERERPVVLTDNGGHTMWVNSKTFELAGITAETLAEEPEKTAFYHRDAQGEPTGWVRGHAATSHLYARLSKKIAKHEMLEAKEYREQTKKLWAYMSAIGITSVFDAHMGGREAQFGKVLVELDKEGKLPFRMVGARLVVDLDNIDVAIADFHKLQRDVQSARVRFGAIKLSLDGTIESRTAGLLAPYARDTNNIGDTKFSPEKLTDFVVKADAAGVDLYIHSIGDRTTRNALDAIAEARRINKSIGKTRHTLTHLHLVDEADIPRFAKLDVMAQTTPIWHAKVPAYADELGARADQLFRLNSIAKTGARVIFGSDYPVAGLGPLVPVFNIETGHTRREVASPSDEPLLPENEKLSIQQLIKGYTRDAAYLLRMEDKIGTLEVGKLADIIVLDRDITNIPAGKLSGTVVKYTFVEGEMVHKRTGKHDWQDVRIWVMGKRPF